ncbi:MAG: hypothetical protein Ct9H90mP26_0170 [Methanobacteriota archaeon]|jgi:hypothetical protein|nr:hypothetical protein [Candidatus Thalassarchaeum sp.]GIS51230.1 MAG: hypothetical protein Ct9H90mP26_0170 [Euryarchaeota archaeon]|tara:strand:+ start:329 stop:622 length:294 start_codon:yes stop_codon:yes gene_type:complete
MPRPKKAARGKHRWVAIQVNKSIQRDSLKKLLGESLKGLEWKLFDSEKQSKRTFAIIKITLSDYQQALSTLNEISGFETITSSGKIRLVRERVKSYL